MGTIQFPSSAQGPAPCSPVLMSLVSTAEARNRIDTAEKAQDLIDRFENDCPHELLPPEYDWLIACRDHLLSSR